MKGFRSDDALFDDLEGAFLDFNHLKGLLFNKILDLVRFCLDRLIRLFQFNRPNRNRLVYIGDQGKAAPNPIVY